MNGEGAVVLCAAYVVCLTMAYVSTQSVEVRVHISLVYQGHLLRSYPNRRSK
jgi:hypothetical protein